MNAREALERLSEGHLRFLGRATAPRPAPEREGLPQEHRPFAAVLSCADARVTPEILFDQPLGELFVVRNAGHVVRNAELASLEFATSVLGVPLVVVLGHTQCAAVGLALERNPGHLPAHLQLLARSIRLGLGENPRDPNEAVRAHVRATLEALRNASEVLGGRVRSGELVLKGAVYDVSTGALEWLR
ncbi:carbonic anhydrase [Oceanithermus sp.]